MESSKGFDIPPLKPESEKQLLRVFTSLRQHERKSKLASKIAELQDLQCEHQRLHTHDQSQMKRNMKINTTESKSGDLSQTNPKTEDRNKIMELEREVMELRKGIQFNSDDTTGQITPTDLTSAMRALNRVATKIDVQWMIWEVDDDGDGNVDWDEFRGAYARCIMDRQGHEPNQLFHLIQFILCDSDHSTKVSASELRDQLLSVRSSEYLIQKLETAFKRSKDESGKLTLTEYLDVMFTDLPPNFM